ncbi:hypothetical protein ON010_g3104 [Phytophthora cinnamomi]|nr:hypothetical protein ON010_g3104 [Phytophthora cinnamomi]
MKHALGNEHQAPLPTRSFDIGQLSQLSTCLRTLALAILRELLSVRVIRHVQRRVAVEEAVRAEAEAGVVNGHDRPVLDAREVREAEGVPDHDVLVVYRSVGLGVGRQTRVPRVLVWRVAGGPHLVTRELRDPQVLGGDIARRSAKTVQLLARGDQPSAAQLVVRLTLRVALTLQTGGHTLEGVAHGVFGADRQALHLELVDVALVAIDGHIQPSSEQVLVARRTESRRHLRGEIVLALGTARREDDARGLALELDLAVQVEVPVEAVVVVAHRHEERDDKTALATHRTRIGEHIRMLPERTKVLFVDADGVLEQHGFAEVVHHGGVEVLDLAEAVTPEHEAVDQAPELVLARVEVVLPLVGGLRFAVGHHHLGDGGAVEDRALGAAVVERDVVQREALSSVEADADLPVLPVEHVVLDREARAFGLRDPQWLHVRAHRARQLRVQVVARFDRDVVVARVDEANDSLVSKVDMGHNAVDRMCEHGVRVLSRQEAQYTNHSAVNLFLIAEHTGRQREVANNTQVGDAALGQGSNVARVGLGDGLSSDVVFVQDRAPAVRGGVELVVVYDLAGRDVDHHLTRHVARLVQHKQTDLTGDVIAGLPAVQRLVVGLAQHHVRVAEVGSGVASLVDNLLHALHLRSRDRVEGVDNSRNFVELGRLGVRAHLRCGAGECAVLGKSESESGSVSAARTTCSSSRILKCTGLVS